MKRPILKNHRREIRLTRRRLMFMAYLLTALWLAIIGRLVELQIHDYRHFHLLADNNRLAMQTLPAKRGLIKDRNGVLLAENTPVSSLVITPSENTHLDNTIEQLKQYVHLTQTNVDAFHRHLKWNKSFFPTTLKLNLNDAEIAQVYLHRYELPGVNVISSLTRHYPEDNNTVAAIGYADSNRNKQQSTDIDQLMNPTIEGYGGIEAAYDWALSGQAGYNQIEVDASGHAIQQLQHVPSKAGMNLTLTIDSRLQRTATAAMESLHGAVVMVDIKTGEILSLSSAPSFSANQIIAGMSNADYKKLYNPVDQPMFNRAIQGQYPFGSTIKPFIALAALMNHVIKAHQSIYDPGHYTLPHLSHVYHDWLADGHGWVDVSLAIIVSCDTFFYEIGHRLGIDRIDDILKKFGFGQRTGVDLLNEKPGLVPTPSWKTLFKHQRWYLGDTVISAVGQGNMMTTPLQLANATAQLANHGQSFRPHLLKSMTDIEGNTTETPITEEDQLVISDKYWNLINQAMQKVITSDDPPGTGFRFGRHPDYSIAAKTGTAQLTKLSVQYSSAELPFRLRDDSLFIGFAPADHPKVAIAVIAEHTNEAPAVARRVMDCYFFSNLCEPPHV